MSVIGTGLSYRNQAESMLSAASDLEKRREAEGQQIEAAQQSQQASLTGLGAGIGWMAGAKAGSVGGPAGMLIGAGIGYLAGEFL